MQLTLWQRFLTLRKQSGELKFWRLTIKQYTEWYLGKRKILYNEPSPTGKQKIIAHNLNDSAILTWEKIHQQHKYLVDLQLTRSAFRGLTLLDLGSGPHPSAVVFKCAKLYCLDPLIPAYTQAGFPLHYYDHVNYIVAGAESIPLPDHSVDAIISVNSIDHVDNYLQTVKEIRRILKPSGKLCIHFHYHSATKEEPIELNDRLVKQSFKWCKKFVKIASSTSKHGYTLKRSEGTYALWSNMHALK